MTQRIAIVGASARAAAYSAHRAGLRPITADLFADEDLCGLCPATRIGCYPDGLLDWLRDARPAAWMYTGALENHPELVDAMAAVCPLWGNRGETLKRVRPPWQLAETLRDADLLFPDTRSSPDGLPRDGSWLTKTCRGAGGSGVSVLAADPVPIAGPLRGPGGIVYQRRVDGMPCCAVYVAAAGAATLLGFARQLVGEQWLGAREFQYCGSIGPWPIDEATHATVTKIGSVLAKRFALVGLFGVDVMLDGRHVWMIEVNPRYTASVEVLERATSVHAIAAHAAAAADGELSIAAAHDDGRCHGKAILFAKCEIVIDESLNSWIRERASSGQWPALADLPPPGTTIERCQPILTLFADGTTPDDVETSLKQRATEIEGKLCAPQVIHS